MLDKIKASLASLGSKIKTAVTSSPVALVGGTIVGYVLHGPISLVLDIVKHII